ncbi:hypothetical protein CTAYLR_002626 [Chrysophaeum taylorii]|uniref:Uncharacterized protein n=1 Tax=Chrysophaeum taylorii TaxID=2483200 RepID=A0AAD7UDY0_9STRA|nr:hypothetical protein CTAYLR_002626 [Chrysophaeum taylorii]
MILAWRGVVVLVVVAAAWCLAYLLIPRGRGRGRGGRKGVSPRTERKDGLWEVATRGFLPRAPPLARPVHPDLQFLGDIGDELPCAIVEGRVKDIVLAHRGDFARCPKIFLESSALEQEELECSFSLLCYVACSIRDEDIGPVGPALASCARVLGRQPMLDYAGCVLYNWELRNPTSGISMENVRMLRRFTGLVDEEWFFKTHLVIEAAAAPVVCAIHSYFCGREDLVSVLRRIEDSFSRVVRECLPLMFADDGGGPIVDAYFFFHRLRPFMSEKTFFLQGESRTYPGPSGAMSTLLPVLDAFLGISNTNKDLRSLLRTFEKSMPCEHRDFLHSIRSIRDLVARGGGGDELGERYDRCVDLVLDFRWRHLQMVKRYVVEPGGGGNDVVGTGGTRALDYLHEHISDTEAAKLKRPRDVVVGSDDEKKKMDSLPPLVVGEEGAFWAVDARKGFGPPSSSRQQQQQLGCFDLKLLARVVRAIPTLCVVKGAFRELVDSVDPDLAATELPRSAAALETVRVLVGFIAAAYMRYDDDDDDDAIVKGDAALPPGLAFLVDSVKLDRTKRLCYADLVLASECRVHFLAVPDEDNLWSLFLKTERRTPRVVAAILKAEAEMRRNEDPSCIDALRAGIRAVADVLDPPLTGGEKATMRRLKKFLRSDDLDLACFLYSGSAVLAALWRFLGVPKAARTSHLQLARDTLRTEPKPHRDFVNNRLNLRAFVLARKEAYPVHELAHLEAAYNATLDELLRLCARKHALVSRYLPRVAAHFSTHEFLPDKAAIQRARLSLVLQRRIRSSSSGGRLQQ